MRALLQRVTSANVTIDQTEKGRIGQGLLVFLGVGPDDSEQQVLALWNKIYKLRIFADEKGKTNLSLEDIKGDVLIVSQFTLYADCRKGNRPSFTKGADPDKANSLYQSFVEHAIQSCGTQRIATGEFGADMRVSLVNDGPFTLWLDV